MVTEKIKNQLDEINAVPPELRITEEEKMMQQ
jgi:hypothetical protein